MKEKIITELDKGKTTAEAVAKKIGCTKQYVSLVLLEYLKENKEELEIKEAFIYKCWKDIKYTKLLYNQKYNGYKIQEHKEKRCLINKKLAPNSFGGFQKETREIIESHKEPLLLEILLKELGIDTSKENIKELKKLFNEFYPHIVILEDRIYNIDKKTTLYNLAKKAHFRFSKMEDFYKELLKSKAARDILKRENVLSYADFQKNILTKAKDFLMKVFDEKYFIRTCAGIEIKQEKNKKNMKIIKEIKDITKEYFCHFHIFLLNDELKKRGINLDMVELKTILLENGFKHNKKTLIEKESCKDGESTVEDIVESVLFSNKFLTTDEIEQKVLKRGRKVDRNMVLSTISKLYSKNKIEKKSVKVPDLSFEKKTGNKRMRKQILVKKKGA